MDKASEGICLDLGIIFSRTDLKLALEHVLESTFPETLYGRDTCIDGLTGSPVFSSHRKKPVHYFLRDTRTFCIVPELNRFAGDRILKCIYDVMVPRILFEVFENTALRLAVFMDHVEPVRCRTQKQAACDKFFPHLVLRLVGKLDAVSGS